MVRNTGVVVQTAVGGSSKRQGLQKIKSEGCHILIGTPGRLNDLLSDTYSGIRAPNLSAFVLDEADRLLDQGFAPEIQNISQLLPDRREVDRQTLMFSATVPQEVMHIVDQTMKPNYKFVRTVQEGEQQTHEKVPQKIVEVAGFENLMPSLVELCKRELARKDREMPFKAIVYFNATAEVALASRVFQSLRAPGATPFDRHLLFPTSIVEIHAKLTQESRTRSAHIFRTAKSSILLSSDVTARGMDFPDVTHVIQVGLPTSRDTYIHRVGRTARGNKNGEGWLFVTPLEHREATARLQRLPLKPDRTLETATVDMTKDAQLPANVAQTLTQVISATKDAPMELKAKAYLATLGYFSWYPRKQDLLDAMNRRSTYGWGLTSPPTISASLAQKLNLSRLNGINIAARGFSDRGDGDHAGRFEYGRDRASSTRGGGFGGRGGSSMFGRGRESYASGGDRDSSSGYGGDRGSFSGFGRDRGSSSGFGRDRGPSSGYGRNGSNATEDSGERSRTSRYV